MEPNNKTTSAIHANADTVASTPRVASSGAAHVSGSDQAALHSIELKSQKMRYRVYTVVLILLSCALLYLLGVVLDVLAIPVGILVWTTIIVFCLKGPVNWMCRKGMKRGLATFLSYVLLFVILFGVLSLTISPAFGMNDQFTDLINNAASYVGGLREWFNGMYSQYAYVLQDKSVSDWVNNAFNSMGSWFSSFASESAQGIVAFGSGVGTSLMIVGFALVVAYWVLLELPQLGAEIRRVAGPKRAQDLKVLHIICTDVMGGYIKGTLIQCAIIGVLCGVAFAILGIPSAAALGVITGVLNIIPVIGPWLGGALAAIVGLFVSPWIALLTLVATIIIQQAIYTFVSPKVLGSQVNIHPALIILALLVGSAVGFAMSGFMGSFVGALLSVPIVAAAKSIFVYYFEKRTGRTIVSEDGVIFQGDPVNSEIAHPEADATGEMTAIKQRTERFPAIGRRKDVSGRHDRPSPNVKASSSDKNARRNRK